MRRLTASIVSVGMILTIILHLSAGTSLAAPREKSLTTSVPALALAPTVPPPPRPIRVRFSGRVDVLPTGLVGQWVIAGVSVDVTEETSLKPEQHIPEVGDWADVKATRYYDGPLVAESIKLQAGSQIADLPVEFKGVIESAEESSLIVGGIIVRTDEDTKTTGTPTIGFLAEVEGLLQPDGSVLADEIDILDPSEVHTEFEGLIEQLPPFPHHGVWLVSGVRVLVSKNPLGPSARLGLSAEVTGVVDDDGLVHADTVTVVDPSPNSIEGIVERIDQDEWTIGGVDICIHKNTLIDESRARAIVGMWAEATVKHRGAATPLAIRIRLERPW